MKLLIYEWVTGGGLVGCGGSLPESLVREGLAMVQAVAADAAALGLDHTLLRDLRLPQLAPSGGRVVEVAGQADHEAALDAVAGSFDAALVIAPETDGVLLRTVRRLEAAGVRLVSPGSAFVAVASDKHRTAQRLHAARVACPEGVVLEPGAPLPGAFDYPGVLKPLDGAGSQDTYVVRSPRDRPPDYAWPRRLERWVTGLAASVALLGVEGGRPVALPACRQRLSMDGRLRYLGGSTPLPSGLAERATRLALGAAEALPPFVGYAGVDLVLGDDPAGSLDAVIEVNPRLTTSYVGLRRAVKSGLLGAVLAACEGDAPRLEIDPRPIAFDADGAVYWAD